MKIIENYIQFSIDNGYPMKKEFYLDDNKYYGDSYGSLTITGLCICFDDKRQEETTCYTLLDIIQSKEFIKSIARGLENKGYSNTLYGEGVDIDLLTSDQAIAIRENSIDGVSLKEFITKLGII